MRSKSRCATRSPMLYYDMVDLHEFESIPGNTNGECCPFECEHMQCAECGALLVVEKHPRKPIDLRAKLTMANGQHRYWATDHVEFLNRSSEFFYKAAASVARLQYD